MSKWRNVNIIVDEDDKHVTTVFVTWYRVRNIKDADGKPMKYLDQTTSQFDIKDINRMIKKYKNDVRSEYKERHINERLLKERKKV